MNTQALVMFDDMLAPLEANFAIVTGDLAHKGEMEAYAALKREFDRLVIPYHLLVGNHDDRGNFRATLPRARFDGLPVTWISAFRAPPTAGFDSLVQRRFPNVTNVDVSASVAQVQRVLDAPEQVSIARTVGTPRAAVSVSTADSPFDPGRVVVVSSIVVGVVTSVVLGSWHAPRWSVSCPTAG